MNINKTWGLIIIWLCIVLVLAVAIISFNTKIERIVKEETFDSMKDLSRIYRIAFIDAIDANKTILKAGADMIIPYNIENKKTAIDTMELIAKSGNFEEVFVSDIHGDSLSNNNVEINIKDRGYYKNVMAGDSNMSNKVVLRTSGEMGVVISMPIIQGDNVIGAIHGAYTLENADKMLLEAFFQEDGYGHIVDQEGDLVLGSNHKKRLISSGNIFEFFENCRLEGGYSVEAIKEDLETGNESKFEINYKGNGRFVYQAPLGINGWSIYSFTTAEINNTQVEAIKVSLLILLVSTITAFSVAIIYISLVRQKNERDLSIANDKYENLISNVQGGVITCIFEVETASSKPIYISEGWISLTGYTMKDLTEKFDGNPQALVHVDDRELANREYMEQTQRGNSYRLQYRITSKEGKIIWVIDRGIIKILEDGSIQNQSIMTDVSEIKEKEAQLFELTQRDPLTGLYNKISTGEKIENIVDSKEVSLKALMVIDIDNFKGINDSKGHIFGDLVLLEVANKLKCICNSKDIIGRIGGDEFVVLLTDIKSEEEANSKAEEICQGILATVIDKDETMRLSCSMGVVVCSKGSGYKELFEMADKALYEAKVKGKNQFIIYKINGDVFNGQ